MIDLLTIDPIRRGRPSASVMGRVFECPASWPLWLMVRRKQAEAGVVIPEGEEARFGSLGHRWLHNSEKDAWEAMPESHRDLAVECLSLFKTCRKTVGLHDDACSVVSEERLWEPVKKRYSGQLDKAVCGRSVGLNKSLIVDFKFGRVVVPKAEVNQQIRTMSVLFADHYSLLADPTAVVYGAVIQPLAPDPLTICEFGNEDLLRAKMELDALMEQIEEPAPPFRTGDWCTFCPARAHCPAIRNEIISPNWAASPRTPAELAAELTPMGISEVLSVMRRGRSFFDEVEARARAMLLADKDSLPGWRIGEPGKFRTIGDTQAAYNLMSDYLSSEQFASACKTSLESLLPYFSKALESRGEFTSSAEAKRMLRKILGPALVQHERAGRIERVEE